MTFTQAQEYLRQYYNDNYADDDETFEDVIAALGDQLDMVTSDVAAAYNVYMENA